MKTLHLTLKKKWFDMIASGEKKEEYRDLNHYWAMRLTLLRHWHPSFTASDLLPREFNQIVFANGGHFGDVPKIRLKCTGIEVCEGRPEWGAEPGKKYFVIKLGERLDSPNLAIGL